MSEVFVRVFWCSFVRQAREIKRDMDECHCFAVLFCLYHIRTLEIAASLPSPPRRSSPSPPLPRFGRDGNRNFLRFGRSVDRQLKEEKDRDTPLAPTAAPAKTQDSHRAKRSATPYNQIVMPSRGPIAWAIDYQPEEEELDETLDAPEVAKRTYNKSYLRVGRDRNFLRFGKRNNDAGFGGMPEPASYPRYVRALQPDTLRFG